MQWKYVPIIGFVLMVTNFYKAHRKFSKTHEGFLEVFARWEATHDNNTAVQETNCDVQDANLRLQKASGDLNLPSAITLAFLIAMYALSGFFSAHVFVLMVR